MPRQLVILFMLVRSSLCCLSQEDGFLQAVYFTTPTALLSHRLNMEILVNDDWGAIYRAGLDFHPDNHRIADLHVPAYAIALPFLLVFQAGGIRRGEMHRMLKPFEWALYFPDGLRVNFLSSKRITLSANAIITGLAFRLEPGKPARLYYAPSVGIRSEIKLAGPMYLCGEWQIRRANKGDYRGFGYLGVAARLF